MCGDYDWLQVPDPTAGGHVYIQSRHAATVCNRPVPVEDVERLV